MRALYLFLFLSGAAIYSCQSQSSGGVVDAKTFYDQIKSAKDPVVLDVRTPEEYAEGHIVHAINLDYYNDDFKDQVRKLDKSKSYFVYCQAGGRSNSAATFMQKEGFLKVYDLDGGILEWQKNKFPVIKE